MSRGHRQSPSIIVVIVVIIMLIMLFVVGITYTPLTQQLTQPGVTEIKPQTPPSGGIFNIPVIGDAARAIESLITGLASTVQPQSDVGIGAIIGYSSTTGETLQYSQWKSSGVILSGISLINPMSGIHIKPDNPEYKALKLYDPETKAEGEIWFQPIISVAIYNGTPVSHSFRVTTKTVLQCDDEPPEILSYNAEQREGPGKPDKQIKFSKSTTKGSKIFENMEKVMKKGKGNNCQLLLMADYDGEILFEGDDEPVKKSLSNIVLGKFELRKISQAGDFEFMVSSNATVRPLAEVMVGGEAGMGELRTVTYTETRYMLSTVGTQTVTKTEVRTKTETVNIVTTTTVVSEVKETVTKTVTSTVTKTYTPVCRPGGCYSGIVLIAPYDAFIFVR
ncbi:MAG: hypothetical protein QXQ33_00580 [Nitrososphaerota archaeon]